MKKSTKLPAPAYASWSLKADDMERYAYVKNFLSPEECTNLIKFAKQYELNMGTVGVNGETFEAYRKSDVVFLPPTNLEWLYRRLTDAVINMNTQFFGFDLFGFTEGLQFTEYKSPGGKYDSHMDIVYKGIVRKLSIVVQLTDERKYKGGDLELLYNGDSDPIKMIREQGTLLAFPSFLMHRVTPMTKGARNSLVGWVSGKPFK